MIAQQNVAINELKKENTRNYGIDALRVLSAVMIVMLHVLSQGGILAASADLTVRGEFMWWLQIGCLGFVNVFALISGYVGIGGKHKISNILNLWLQVVLYTFLSKVLIMVFFEKSFSVLELGKAFLPVITSENWYFTAYFVLFFFLPFFNECLEKAEQTTVKKALLFSVLLFMAVETISSVKESGIQAGYSVLWLAVMYVLGAYLKKYDPLRKLTSWQCGIGVVSCMTLTLLSKLLIELVTWKLLGAPGYGTKFLVYTSPVMVLQAVFFVQLFSHWNLPKPLQKFAVWFAPMTFGVFVIHTTTFIYRYMLRDAFSFVSGHCWIVALGIGIAATIVIWLVCSGIDFLRICLFKLFRINKLTAYLGTKIETLLNRIIKIKKMEK